MKPINRRTFVATAAFAIGAPYVARSDKRYDEGVTDKEIKIGNFSPYSGPASAYASIGQTHQVFWKWINEAGGINGRKINFITLDDGYSPPKAVEVTRQLVEQNKVFCLFNPVGTATNIAVQKYMNQKKVPQLFVASGASRWSDPQSSPWTIGFEPDWATEAAIYAKRIMANPNAKVAMLYQNDDFGMDYLRGFHAGFAGDKSKYLTATESYEVTDQTVDSQIAKLKDSGAGVLLLAATRKMAEQAIRRAAKLRWNPVTYVARGAALVPQSIGGQDHGNGIITAAYLMNPTDNQWKDNEEMKSWRGWMDKNMPQASKSDVNHIYAYAVAYLMAETLKRCGDELTRANLMKQVATFQNFRVPLLLPGILINTSPTNFHPIEAVHLVQLEGTVWKDLGLNHTDINCTLPKVKCPTGCCNP